MFPCRTCSGASFPLCFLALMRRTALLCHRLSAMACCLARDPKETVLADHGPKPPKPLATKKHFPLSLLSPQMSSHSKGELTNVCDSHRPASSFPETSISLTTHAAHHHASAYPHALPCSFPSTPPASPTDRCTFGVS